MINHAEPHLANAERDNNDTHVWLDALTGIKRGEEVSSQPRCRSLRAHHPNHPGMCAPPFASRRCAAALAAVHGALLFARHSADAAPPAGCLQLTMTYTSGITHRPDLSLVIYGFVQHHTPPQLAAQDLPEFDPADPWKKTPFDSDDNGGCVQASRALDLEQPFVHTDLASGRCTYARSARGAGGDAAGAGALQGHPGGPANHPAGGRGRAAGGLGCVCQIRTQPAFSLSAFQVSLEPLCPPACRPSRRCSGNAGPCWNSEPSARGRLRTESSFWPTRWRSCDVIAERAPRDSETGRLNKT
jgi:hypothetical protein